MQITMPKLSFAGLLPAPLVKQRRQMTKDFDEFNQQAKAWEAERAELADPSKLSLTSATMSRAEWLRGEKLNILLRRQNLLEQLLKFIAAVDAARVGEISRAAHDKYQREYERVRAYLLAGGFEERAPGEMPPGITPGWINSHKDVIAARQTCEMLQAAADQMRAIRQGTEGAIKSVKDELQAARAKAAAMLVA